MNGATPLADVRGQQRAEDFLQALKANLTTGEELHACVLRCPPDELQSFLRRLQKELERPTR